MTYKQAKKVIDKNEKKATEIANDNDRFQKFLDEITKKIKDINLRDELSNIPLLIDMLKSYYKKEYTKVPLKTIITIIGALIYFLSPADIIPDVIPVVGYVDDATVIGYCVKSLKDDILDYKEYKESKESKNESDETLSIMVGNFIFNKTSIEGVYKIDVKKYGDNRGYFMETYKKADFDAAGLKYDFVQDNQSKSKTGVLRGLHFQKTFPQAKLVRCIEGEVFDVCVDLRKGSKTYGKWEGVVLSAEKGNQFMIPRGFAHGFVVLSETATFCYKCDELYHPEDEGGIMWNDSEIGIEWPYKEEPLLSKKDKKHPTLKDSKMEF